MKKFALSLRKIHKILMLFLGGQFVLWSLSGLYMVVMDIDFIHGDHLVKEPIPLVISSMSTLSFKEILHDSPQAKRLKLTNLAQQSVYQFSLNGQPQLVSARTGESVLPLSQEDIKGLVNFYSNISNESIIKHIRLLTDNAPSELSARHLPVWQIVFDDSSTSTLYISPTTGQVVTKRHDYWRFFDFVWMLHIMDYENREDITNWLLFVFSLTGILSCLSGLYLVGNRFRLIAKLRHIFSTTRKPLKTKVEQPSETVIKGAR